MIEDSRIAIWYFNINQEQLWNTSQVFPSMTDKLQLELVKQQEQQQLFIAEPHDIVLMNYTLDYDYLQYLQSWGIQLPQIVMQFRSETLSKLQHDNSLLIPYIFSEESYIENGWIRELKILGGSPELVKSINNKFTTRRLAEEYGFNITKGYFCYNINELQSAYHKLCESGFRKCVIKIPFGSSGKGLRIIENTEGFNTFLKFIQRRSTTFELLIEGWYCDARCINGQLWVAENKVEVIAVTEQKIDLNGVYEGTNYTPDFHSLVIHQYSQELVRLGEILQERGYRGICGIDSIIDREGFIYPIIEINARLTQVTYLLPVVNRLINSYPYIHSMYRKFDKSYSLGFKEILSELTNLLEPDDRNKFLIYTFAKTETEGSKSMYRVYVLFYGKDYVKFQNMLVDFSNSR
ncbi:ATP-grasp domain-containing protein [Paenibacillus plantarum]|nr:ATP-grasp domain-containing protein [Paenibacillus plantarum]